MPGEGIGTPARSSVLGSEVRPDSIHTVRPGAEWPVLDSLSVRGIQTRHPHTAAGGGGRAGQSAALEGRGP